MDAEQFGNGWAFYKRGGVHGDSPIPVLDDPLDLIDWVNGFAAALADDDLDGQYPSLQAALLGCGIDGELLKELLEAAEVINDGDEWCRWPAGRPTRGLWLPMESANDEVG